MKRPAGRTFLKALAVVVGVGVSAALISSVFFRLNPGGAGPLLVPRFPLEKLVHDLPGHLRWLIPFMLLS
ncbi:MAG TPA: UPF0104 family protein, partial [Archangium sp.]|nr:UPF0104 family protein [Archangium sp.]